MTRGLVLFAIGAAAGSFTVGSLSIGHVATAWIVAVTGGVLFALADRKEISSR